MALNSTTIQADCKTVVKAAFQSYFDSNPPTTSAAIADAMADVIVALIPTLVTAIKNTADVTGVTAGSDTVAGGVN